MHILETIAVIVMFLALGVVASLGMGFFVLKLQLPSQKIKEMDRMQEFLKNDKNVIKDVDYFFTKQWKPYIGYMIGTGIIFTIIGTLVLFLCGITTYFGNGTEYKEAGLLLFKGTGIFSSDVFEYDSFFSRIKKI